MEIDRDSGAVLRSWGSNIFYMPHGLTVDQHGNLWLADTGLHQVRAFPTTAAARLSLTCEF
jgi:peptidylamidoglycolate lyase